MEEKAKGVNRWRLGKPSREPMEVRDQRGNSMAIVGALTIRLHILNVVEIVDWIVYMVRHLNRGSSKLALMRKRGRCVWKERTRKERIWKERIWQERITKAVEILCDRTHVCSN